MMKALFPLVLQFILAINCLNFCFGQTGSTTKLIFIRHGEKPAKGTNLSCQGLNRALQLPPVLYAKFGIPAYTFVAAPSIGKSTNAVRMLETVIPFAVKYNLTINSTYDKDDVTGIIEAIRKRNGTILLVWEHKAILPILRALGIKDETLEWKEDDFDSIWIVTLGKGNPSLQKDKEGLHPSPNCL